jgi:hypothetical protein
MAFKKGLEPCGFFLRLSNDDDNEFWERKVASHVKHIIITALCYCILYTSHAFVLTSWVLPGDRQLSLVLLYSIVALRLLSFASTLAVKQKLMGRKQFNCINCIVAVCEMLRLFYVMQGCVRGLRYGVQNECTVLPGEYVGSVPGTPRFVGICVDILYVGSPLYLKGLGVDFTWVFFSLIFMPFGRMYALSVSATEISKSAFLKDLFLGLVFLYNMGTVWMLEKGEKTNYLQAKQIEQASKNLSRVFQDASSPIFRIDKGGYFLFWNKVLFPSVLHLFDMSHSFKHLRTLPRAQFV